MAFYFISLLVYGKDVVFKQKTNRMCSHQVGLIAGYDWFFCFVSEEGESYGKKDPVLPSKNTRVSITADMGLLTSRYGSPDRQR